jgi:[protein-PII] uridylyltransferase
MPIQSPLISELKGLYDAESARLQHDFSTTKNGLSYLRQRSALVDSVVLRLAAPFLSPEKSETPGIVLVALGDFGRRSLFPYSDIDLLFLHAAQNSADRWQHAIEQFSEGMSAVGLKPNTTIKDFSEFHDFDSENAESILSLLDCRFLAGDQELFSRLRDKLIPEVMARESQVLAERLAEMTRNRHRKFANTVFHLEPDVKDGPGGYQDYALACWLAAMSAMEKQHGWPNPDTLLSPEIQNAMDHALSFLASVRCFLNFRALGNDNVLTWDAQNDAAAQKIGATDLDIHSATEWMRIYFGHARDVDRISGQLLEEMPAAQSLFYRQLETWRTGFSDADFSVVDGLIFFQTPENMADGDLFFRTFRLIAQRGFKLSPTAEHQLELARPILAGRLPRGSALWQFLQELLPESHAADALRAMHSLHLLTMVLPEFQGIDALAVRDVSHRFTVDEHTLQAIENLHALRQSKSKWDERYAGILDELDQPELLYLAILLHDTGKAVTVRDHVPESIAIARGCLERLELPEADRRTVLFLIEHHLDMAATLRRDIFDSRTVAQFAENVGSPDRLRMLCLFTHADIKAVSPEALTPWKAEDLWQLYIGTANYLNRTVDERVHADANDEVLNHLR